jgi:hypothetical protein
MSLPGASGPQESSTVGELSQALRGEEPRWWSVKYQLPDGAECSYDHPSFCLYKGQLVMVLTVPFVQYMQGRPTSPNSRDMGRIKSWHLKPRGATLFDQWAAISQILASAVAAAPDCQLQVWCPVDRRPVAMHATLTNGLLAFILPAELVEAIIAAQ